LHSATGRPAHFTWSVRIDPQIAMGYGEPTYAAEKYRADFNAFADLGDGIGIHPHAWRWDEPRRLTVADHADPAYVNSCLSMAVTGFREVFGRLPGHHRYGAGYMATGTMNLLAQLGVGIDLTVEPGEPPNRDRNMAGTVWTGTNADFRGALREVYRPSEQDYLCPCGAGDRAAQMWEIPLTSGTWPAVTDRERLARRLRHPLRSAYNLAGRARRLYEGDASGVPGHRLLSMWTEWESPAAFWDAAWTAALSLERPYMAFAVRTDSWSDPHLAYCFERLIDALAEDPRSQEMQFVTPLEALSALGLS
jgi:hypothetical protein